MSQFRVEDGDDWVKIFKDDKLIYEGHQPDLDDFKDILEGLGHEVSVQYGYYADEEFVADPE